jgi:hypothetical protein
MSATVPVVIEQLPNAAYQIVAGERGMVSLSQLAWSSAGCVSPPAPPELKRQATVGRLARRHLRIRTAMLSSPKQAALEVSAGSASSVRPWTERSGRPATTAGRIVAFDRSVPRQSKLRA